MLSPMKRIALALVLAVATGGVGQAPVSAQTITTEQDDQAGDRAELQSLAQEAHGDVYSLPHDKKMRLAEIQLKYYIRANFIDPESVHAVITNDPHHADLRVWRGLLGGGHATYSGMEVCARINGKNRLGGYAGEKTYLMIFSNDGQVQAFWSPYYSAITQSDETNSTVTENC